MVSCFQLFYLSNLSQTIESLDSRVTSVIHLTEYGRLIQIYVNLLFYVLRMLKWARNTTDKYDLRS